MHRSRNKWTGQDSGHHGLPVVGRTARGGGAHGRAPLVRGRPGFSLCLFVFQRFLLLLAIKYDVLGL